MKLPGWESKLYTYLENSKGVQFAWGENDCCLWVARFVDQSCGTSYEKMFEGKYNTCTGAYAFMRDKGFENTADVADAHFHSIPITFAARGDLVLHPQGALGICAGRRSFFLKEEGLIELETLQCQKAWEI